MVDFAGTWFNEHDSVMQLKVGLNGEISGSYQTGIGSPQPSEPFPLVGFASDDLLAFSVNFGKYGSLTSWAGQHTGTGSEQRIETMWHLAANVPDEAEPPNLWRSVWTGADVFKRQRVTATNTAATHRPSHPLAKKY